MIRRILIFIVLMLCTSSSSFAQSDRGKLVGKETVREWRRTAERAEWYEIGYAQGAMVVASPMFDCPNRISVGEFGAWLRHTANADIEMGAAVITFFADRGCTLRDEIRQTIIRQERRLE